MSDYIPPFNISNEMLEYISNIMEKVGKLNNFDNLNRMPRLRRNTRIRSIHSSLAIEANSLSLNQVKDVIDGKLVLGEQREIQEVKNAYNAYEEIDNIDPYNISDLKKIHGIMSYLIVEDSGKFRSNPEGVFDGDKCIFMAPSERMVPELMDNLFDWMITEKNKIHPLILSSVFHYEFLFIHPFVDCNGRMARLWQNTMLSKWKPLFKYVPIESRIKQYQEEYYKVISKCHSDGNSNSFIEFMLKMIDETLEELISNAESQINYNSIYVNKLLEVMEKDFPMTANEIMEKLNLKSKETFRKNYIDPAIDAGLVKLEIPDKPTSKNQRYYKV